MHHIYFTNNNWTDDFLTKLKLIVAKHEASITKSMSKSLMNSKSSKTNVIQQINETKRIETLSKQDFTSISIGNSNENTKLIEKEEEITPNNDTNLINKRDDTPSILLPPLCHKRETSSSQQSTFNTTTIITLTKSSTDNNNNNNTPLNTTNNSNLKNETNFISSISSIFATITATFIFIFKQK
jgi:hypothetical protein